MVFKTPCGPSWSLFLFLVYHVTIVLLNLTHTASADSEEEEGSSRLPSFVTPIHYDLTLLPVLENNPKLCGHVWINVKAQETSQFIVLNAASIVPIDVSVYISENQTVNSRKPFERVEEVCFSYNVDEDEPEKRDDDDLVHGLQLDVENDHLIIILKEELIIGASYRVGVLYKAEIYDSDNIGFFRIEHKVNGSECCKRWIGATQLEATHARRMFPCLDEPSYKATFDVSVGHTSKLNALSNMPLKSTKPMKSAEEWVWDTFEASPPMSSYLVACVLSEMEYLESHYQSIDGRNVTVRLWTESRNFKQLELAYDLVPKIMMAMENYLAVPYALPKLDMIALPGYAVTKAMENWGLIVQSETNFFVDKDLSDDIERTSAALTMVHEIAHQWFGNLVTSTWWDDIWLNEGLSTLFENIVLNQVAPELKPDTFIVLFTQQAFSHDKIASSLPLNYPVELLPTVDHKFDGFAYAKASAIFRMVRSFIGDDIFKSALRRYFQQFKFKSANSTDLWNLINQEARTRYTITSRMNVARIMKKWTDKAGYPVIHVQRNSNGTIQLTQSLYVDPDFPLQKNASESADWWVPISMTSGAAPSFSLTDRLPKVWLSPKRPTVAIDGPNGNDIWVLVNLEYCGYYRVNYDETGWNLLADQLLKNHTAIPLLNRAQLIDDAFVLAKSKYVSYTVIMKLIEYLGQVDEDNYVRSVASGHVNRIEQGLIFQNLNGRNKTSLDEIVKIMKGFVIPSKSIISRTDPVFSNEFGTGTDCQGEDDPCSNDTIELLHDYMNGSMDPTQTKLMKKHLDSIWCTALKYGGSNEWKYVWTESRMTSNKLLTEKKKILKAMACTTDITQAKQLLTRVFHPNIQQEPIETLIILKSMAKNPSTRHLALNFVIKNWGYLKKHVRNASQLRNTLVHLTAGETFSSVDEVKKVTMFLEKNMKELGPEITDLIVSRIEKSSILNGRMDTEQKSYVVKQKSPNNL